MAESPRHGGSRDDQVPADHPESAGARPDDDESRRRSGEHHQVGVKTKQNISHHL